MPSQHDKLWSQKRTNDLAVQRAKEAIQQLGHALPCRVTAVAGALVTVAFEVDSTPWVLPQITIPKAESNWVRMPTQVGDTGITVPADTYIENIVGSATATPKITVQPGNLSALVFLPVSRKPSPPQDQNAAIVQGPNGFIGQTTTGTASSVITDTSGTTITFGSTTLVINASGVTIAVGGVSYSFTATAATFDGVNFTTHTHGGVQPGSGSTGAPQ